MQNQNFNYSFSSSKPAEEIFEKLLDVKTWWSGFYDETITGNIGKVNDEFSFDAGGGVHRTSQKIVEIVPNKKIVWLVTKANLDFVDQKDEWMGTRFYFELSEKGGKTAVTFTHSGLTPAFECYESCSHGWMLYLKQLEEKLNEA